MTMNELWPEYIRYKQAHVRPSTIATYANLWASITDEFGKMDVTSFRTKAIEKWVTEQMTRLSKKSVKDRIILINNMLDYAAYEYELPIQRISLKQIRWPRVQKKNLTESNKSYSPEELRKIIVYAAENPSPHSLLVAIMVATGIRIGEASALTFDDIDVAEGLVRISKTIERIFIGSESEYISEERLKDFGITLLSRAKRTAVVLGGPKSKAGYREIPLPSELLRVLKFLKKVYPENYYIGTNSSSPIEPRSIRSHYERMIKKGVKLNRCLKPHALRHSYASMLVTSGVDVRTVSELLGHSDVTTTLQIYSHASITSKKKAVNSTIGKQFRKLKGGEI